MAHEYRMTILERHLDSFSHVNNATYAEIFEEARWDMVTGIGFGLDRVMHLNQGLIIIEMKIRFRKELRLREDIRIVSTVDNPQSKIHKVLQTIYKEDGTVASEGEFVSGFFDLKERQLVAPPEVWKNAVRESN